MDHHELIDALESAEAGSRVLSDAVLLALGWLQTRDPCLVCEDHGVCLWLQPNGVYHDNGPSPTESVDDALSLAPEGYGAISANISERGPSSMRISHPYTFGNAATPALALCIAILRAADHHTTGGRG